MENIIQSDTVILNQDFTLWTYVKKNNGKDRQNWFLENDLYGENQRQQRTGGMGNELEVNLEHEEINQDGSIGKEY